MNTHELEKTIEEFKAKIKVLENEVAKMPDEEKAKISDLPIGAKFEYRGREWVRLGEEQGGILCILADMLKDEQEFGEDADYSKSEIKAVLEAFSAELNADDLLPYTMDLTSDNGDDTLKEYKTNGAGLICCGLYRKYYKYIPKYKDWWWTCTPWGYSTNAGYVRGVGTSGGLYNSYAHHNYGVVPVCILKPITEIRHVRGDKKGGKK